jgi:hypothetical protein
MKQLYTKSGKRIRGTLEQVRGVANVIGFDELPNGSIEPEYEGGTDIWWDEQRTVKDEDGKTIYVDADGDEHTIDNLEVREES